MDHTDFVTVRTKYRHRSNSYCGDESSSSLYEDPNRSLPNTSYDISHNEISNEQIEKLRTELNSANQEIENLLTENQRLQNEIEKSNKLIDIYKTFRFSETVMTPITARRRKKPRNSPSNGHLNKKIQFLIKDDKQTDKSEDENLLVEPKENNNTEQTSNDGVSNTTKTTEETNTKTVMESGPMPLLEPIVKTTREVDVEKITNICDETTSHNSSIAKLTINENIQQDNIQNLNIQTTQEIKLKKEHNATKTNNTRTNTDSKKQEHRRRIVIIGDEQCNGMRNALQMLVGSKFIVTSFWKTGAKLSDITTAERDDISKLNDEDYVILIGGVNEVNPFEFTSNIIVWLHSNRKANIIVCEIPYNKHLREQKLNYSLRLICNQHKNVSFLDMDYGRFPSRKYTFVRNLSRSLLRILLRNDYATERNKYENMLNHQHTLNMIRAHNQTRSREQVDRCTQTDPDYSESNNMTYEHVNNNNLSNDISIDNDNNNNDNNNNENNDNNKNDINENCDNDNTSNNSSENDQTNRDFFRVQTN